MQREYDLVISDTSCFILFDNINELELLQKLFNRVYTTEEIALKYKNQLPDWVDIRKVKDKEYQSLLALQIDRGEASAIALSVELEEKVLLILDDKQGRKLADKLDLNYIGSLGVILKAKQSGIIASIKPVLTKIQHTNFRFSERIYKEIIEEAGE